MSKKIFNLRIRDFACLSNLFFCIKKKRIIKKNYIYNSLVTSLTWVIRHPGSLFTRIFMGIFATLNDFSKVVHCRII